MDSPYRLWLMDNLAMKDKVLARNPTRKWITITSPMIVSRRRKVTVPDLGAYTKEIKKLERLIHFALSFPNVNLLKLNHARSYLELLAISCFSVVLL
jgi:hypothetical protein